MQQKSAVDGPHALFPNLSKLLGNVMQEDPPREGHAYTYYLGRGNRYIVLFGFGSASDLMEAMSCALND